MATLHVNLPDNLKSLAEARAAEAGHASVEDYLAALVRADTTSALSDELEQALLEGLGSGPAIEVTPQFWSDLKARRHRPTSR